MEVRFSLLNELATTPMFGLIRNLFRAKPEHTISDDPFKRNIPFKPTPSKAPPPHPNQIRVPGISVSRDEIIGKGSRLVGYRFQTRQQGTSSRPEPSVIVDALKADNLINFAQRRIALVPIELGDWAAADFAGLIAPEAVFYLQAKNLSLSTPDWLDMLSEVKSAGAKTAIAMITASNHSMLLGLTDILVIDLKEYSLEGLERQIKSMRASHPQISIAIDGVTSWAEYRLCQDLGVSYSLGGFAASPDDEKQGEKLNQSRLVLFEMLNLLRSDAEVTDLVAVAKRDPGVALKVVDMANSPLSGLSAPVASIQQALVVLGRDMLYRWLALGIYRAGNHGYDETLLEFALSRARFLELVAHPLRSKTECDELFLVGMLSLLDNLLGIPMDKAIETMTLPGAVRNVLLRSEGNYGRFLMLALAVEKGSLEQAMNLAGALGLEMTAVEDARSASLAWMEEALQAT